MQKLEETLLLQSDEIFDKALFYSNGDHASALERVFQTTLWIAKKHKGLANKDRALDLFYERLASQSVKKSERAGDVKTAISEAFALYRRNQKRKGVLSLCLLTVVLLMAIYPIARYCIVPALNSDENPSYTTQTDAEGNVIQPVIGAVTMKNTKTIQGDNKIVSFENYQNLSKTLKKNTTPNIIHADIYTEIERYAASVTAPDGTTYMAFNNITNEEDAGNIIFDLYRMETDGWNKVAEGESQVMYRAGSYSNYFASRIYLVADKESNIYVFVLLNDAVTVYRYDCKTGKFTKSDSVLFSAAPSNHTVFSVYYDENYGECGGVYVGYAQNRKYCFSCYDIARDEYVNIAEKICSSADSQMMFCVNNSTIHMVVQGGYTLKYYQIASDGTYQSKTLFSGSLYAENEYIFNRNCGSGGIATDKNGVVHIVATHHAPQEDSSRRYKVVCYTINSDLTFEKEILSKLYYTTTDSYVPLGMGVFNDEDGNVCYIEKYKSYTSDRMNVLAIGRMNDDGSVTCIDVIELPDGITRGGSYLMNNMITFYSDNDIYYFEIKGLGD